MGVWPSGSLPLCVSDRTSEQATAALERLTGGEARAADDLTPLVYDQLKRLAAGFLRSERADHTLQPTALLHEAYVRLIEDRSLSPENQDAFMALAATVMRRVLVDHARAKKSLKRGGDRERVSLDAIDPADTRGDRAAVDLEALDAVLTRLSEVDERKARIVELRFFGGIDEAKVAEIMGISRVTAARDWRMVRAWLTKELARGGSNETGAGP